jgi:hypothetical protein
MNRLLDFFVLARSHFLHHVRLRLLEEVGAGEVYLAVSASVPRILAGLSCVEEVNILEAKCGLEQL